MVFNGVPKSVSAKPFTVSLTGLGTWARSPARIGRQPPKLKCESSETVGSNPTGPVLGLAALQQDYQVARLLCKVGRDKKTMFVVVHTADLRES